LLALLIVAGLAHHRDGCAKCRRGSCLVAALPAAADEGRAGGDHRFPWRWQVISQKREVGVVAADDSEPGHLTAMGRIPSKLTEVSYPTASGSGAAGIPEVIAVGLSEGCLSDNYARPPG
jgi:hypothetical protein